MQRHEQGLTQIQREVLRLVQAGLSNKEIAQHRGVSEQAVKRQVSILLRRFAVDGRWALIRQAYEHDSGSRLPADGKRTKSVDREELGSI